MIPLLVAIFFVFGLIIGSFLNVVIYRFNTERSFGGRSACMSCRHQLAWYELIPIFSFLGLRGRCRNCQTKISVQYVLVEFITGIIFASLFFKFQDLLFLNSFIFFVTYAYYTLMFSLLVVIATYDLKHKIIPDSLSLVFGVLAFIGLFFFINDNFQNFPVFAFHVPSILEFLSGVFIAFPFAFFWIISGGRWMGLGDAKLAIGIGWLLGISLALSGLVMAFWSGAIIGIGLIILSRNNKQNRVRMKSEIPFAPFLVFGALISFIFGLNLFWF